MKVRSGLGTRPLRQSIGQIVTEALPKRGLSKEVNAYRLKNMSNIWRGLWRIVAARVLGISHSYGVLRAKIIRGDGTSVPIGVISYRVVTTAGVGYLVDTLQNLTEPENFKYHGFGIGTAAESSSDTALGTELTTEYQTNSTRPTGTQTEGAGANIYRTVGTLTPDSGGVLAITEHAVFSASSAGTCLDRSKFSAVNLDSANGDSLQVTYELTLPAGS